MAYLLLNLEKADSNKWLLSPANINSHELHQFVALQFLRHPRVWIMEFIMK